MTVSSMLAGKVALVTGASSGIGEATAAALAAAGARVAVAARRVDRLEALAARIEKIGGTALRIEADVTSNDDVAAMVGKVVAEWGRLDILVNNAGVMLLSPAAEATLDDWRHMVELNLLALMGVTKAALPHLKAAKGHIVNVSSVAGRVANPGASGYAATKFGVVGFSESLRREVYADKVRVTVIEPGLVRTELGDHITNAASKAGLDQRLATMEALTAEDVAAAILYAVGQPARVNVNEIVIRPTDQER
ncbi:short-chain alcohol dehydrogenase [Mesorhizobium australicum WSM2073]|uniref:Short-chain alcohol dehydrogenase n=1 Tax=Mesorhizobium australicum (strain HAMBI 3006 / LMG 24608 / WSM2073) TaxID=754035 RepID=L0KSF4_MESAW|nr:MULTISPECIES: SDR family NAD(P)-dependent oxidoreductase [Mesorhizobium]MBZ9929175.1 SDR family NAD(P)-dependent oxidoreductase [Mesorhizobium sp. BR1-1-5]AGB47018.1 short-chain alcohol dehydrogenase [Mesorhizobium australicum WSM2073]MBZ9679867.1 SDR family NAD(P)-dependent oxidoreductase [Mesorhizobium sp. CO1-1-2]MBZ9905017.1 SDR family NAD(P)-dependent oxidoreductase [Mesorhizobium sp. BR115XR7A]MBZ9924781.1 SDR family NAD(P)-dependent oxidoreductase [Mesorhizobium sp. BR1-1-4]